MRFCVKCDNLYYIKVPEDSPDTLIHYCRNCGNEESNLDVKNLSISKIQLKGKVQTHNTYINEYTKFDPTIPRINDIPCPNINCPSKGGEIVPEVLYVRYDDINVRYVYMCCKCDTTWTSNTV